MSDPNSNTAEVGAGGGAAVASGANQTAHSPSEGRGPDTDALPLDSADRDVPHILETEASIAVISTDQSIDDSDLHGAVVSTIDAAMFNVDYTLDQLINSSDLFDVPALDFSDDVPT